MSTAGEETAERWETEEQIYAARDAFMAQIDGWVNPEAHGLGFVPSGEEPSGEHFPLVNVRDHMLPAVVAATVAGHTSGTAAYPLSREQLARAIDLLEPAEACLAFEHPNLWWWRDVLLPALDADPEARVYAVFVGPDAAGSTDPAVVAFRIAVDVLGD